MVFEITTWQVVPVRGAILLADEVIHFFLPVLARLPFELDRRHAVLTLEDEPPLAVCDCPARRDLESGSEIRVLCPWLEYFMPLARKMLEQRKAEIPNMEGVRGMAESPAQREITESLNRLREMRQIRAQLEAAHQRAIDRNLPVSERLARQAIYNQDSRIAAEEAWFEFLLGGLP